MQIKWNEVTWYSKLLAIIFFLGVLPVLMFYIGMRYREETVGTHLVKTESISLLVNSSVSSTTSSDISFLYPNLSWQSETSTLGRDALNYDHPHKETWGTISVEGKQWHSSLKSISDEKLNTIKFVDFIKERYLNNGWFQEVNLNTWRITPIQADGPHDSVWGYMKLENNTVREVIFSISLQGVQVSKDNEPIEYKCPCDVEYKLFISNPIDSNLLEKQF